MLPDASTAAPTGALNRAVPTAPSRYPELPPAAVETNPAGVILRIRLLPESATMTFAAPSAALPMPSAKPGEPDVPATVVTTPSGVTLRIVWNMGSARKRLPLASTAMPTEVIVKLMLGFGVTVVLAKVKRAALPELSTHPGEP